MNDRWSHLAARFFTSLRHLRPLSAGDRAEVQLHLSPAEASLYWEQPNLDQHHGLVSLRHAAAETARADVLRAALLHDIGKRHSQLGILGRVLAWVFAKVRLPLLERFRRFHDHGRLGSEELAALGAEDLVVDFARFHHAERPSSIDAADWDLLIASDY